MSDAYQIRHLIVDGLIRALSRPVPMCPYCLPKPGWPRQAIHADGVTCGSPDCKQLAILAGKEAKDG
jgi:hypothetical protein